MRGDQAVARTDGAQAVKVPEDADGRIIRL